MLQHLIVMLDAGQGWQERFVGDKRHPGADGGLHVHHAVSNEERLARLYAEMLQHLEKRLRMRFWVGHLRGGHNTGEIPAQPEVLNDHLHGDGPVGTDRQVNMPFQVVEGLYEARFHTHKWRQFAVVDGPGKGQRLVVTLITSEEILHHAVEGIGVQHRAGLKIRPVQRLSAKMLHYPVIEDVVRFEGVEYNSVTVVNYYLVSTFYLFHLMMTPISRDGSDTPPIPWGAGTSFLCCIPCSRERRCCGKPCHPL